MKRRCKIQAKIDLEEEEEDSTKSMAFDCSSDDDEEANKDLSLEIVEKARKREEKRKRVEDFGGSDIRQGIIDISSLSPSHGSAFIDLGGDAEDLSVEIVENVWKFESKRKREAGLGGSEQKSFKNDEVIDLDSLSPSDEVELISTGEDAVEGEQKKKNPKKKMRWRKKKREKAIEEEKNFINNINTEESSVTVEAVRTDAVEVFDNDMKAEENFVAVEDVDVEGSLLDNVVNAEPLEATESTVPEAIGTSDNAILRKLLRGPRYFDPPDGNWGTCYNCGKEGHTIANCTEEKRKKPCFVCGKFGHGAKNCTQGQDCYICKRRGHIAKNCPEKHQQSSQSFKICLRCGDLGHDMSSCGNDYSLEDLKEIQCYICKCFGHLCCANIIDNGPREVSCYNCGRSGHTGVGCAKARREASSAASPTICYRCGEEGHFARGCNKSKSGQWNGEPSTPSQRFFKAHKKAGFRSVPHDVGKIQKNKRTPNSERKYMTTGKSKQRGGWITDDPGDLPNRKGKVNGWMSPATPDGKGQSAAGRFSSSQSSFRKPKGRFGTPSSHDSPNPSMHKFSASRFSNNKGHYWRAHD